MRKESDQIGERGRGGRRRGAGAEGGIGGRGKSGSAVVGRGGGGETTRRGAGFIRGPSNNTQWHSLYSHTNITHIDSLTSQKKSPVDLTKKISG